MRVFKIAAGVILILSGVFCFANPGAAFLSVAFLLGCAMLLSGISGILAYIRISRKREISNSLMIEGMTSILLGLPVLCNQLAAEAAVPVFFGMWVLFAGVIRVSEAYTHRNLGRTERICIVSLGLISIIAGLYAFFNTVLFALSPVLLTGILFVIQGANVLTVGVTLSFHHRRADAGAERRDVSV